MNRRATLLIRPHDALAIAAIFLIVVTLNWSALTGATHYLQPMDTAESLYITDFRFLADALRKGEWGLWDPHTFGGFPVFANPHSAFFYPINRLFLSLPWGDDPFPPRAYTLYILAHLALQGAAQFALLRVIGLRWEAALIGSLSFVLLPIMGNTGRGHQLVPVAWWPLLVLFILMAERSCDRRWLGYAALGGISFGVIFTVPNPQAAFALLILGLLALVCLIKTRGHPATVLKVAGIFSIVGIIGALTAAVALMPLAELLSTSRRWYTETFALDGSDPLPFEKFGLTKFDLHQFAGFLFSDLSRAVNATNFIGWFVVGAGLYAFASIISRFASRRSRHAALVHNSAFMFGAIFPASVVIISALIMFDLGSREILYYLPGLNKIRHLSEYMFVLAFGAAILVGYSADQVLGLFDSEGDARSRWRRIGAAIIIAACAASAVVQFTTPDWWSSMSISVPRGIASFLLVAAAIYFIRSRYAARALATVLLVGALIASLSNTRLTQFSYSDYDISGHYSRNESFKRFVPSDTDPYRVFPTAKPDVPRYNWNLADYIGFYDVFGLSNMMIASTHDAYLYMLDMEDSGITAIANLMNIRYLIVSAASAEKMTSSWPETFRREDDLPADVLSWQPPMTRAATLAVARNLSAPGQAWAVTRYESVHRSAPEHFNLLRSNPELLTTRASVEGPLNESDRVLMEQARDGPAKISWNTHASDRLVLQVTSDTPRMLVLSEVFYPGWKATVNGQPAATYKIFGHIRGVVVPGGEVRVELNFWPASLTIGATFSLLGIVLSSLLIFAGFRRKGNGIERLNAA